MKRFHVHVAVADLPANVAFYSKLFGQAPSKQRQDYAKWLLDDPRVNFAISSRSHSSGVNHFGFQAEDADELAALKRLADTASGGTTLEQAEARCCYANSEKHWTADPQGIAWEHFLTTSDAEGFGEDAASPSGACCIPLYASEAAGEDAPAACCLPNDTSACAEGEA